MTRFARLWVFQEIDELYRDQYYYLEPGDLCYFWGEYTPERGYQHSDTNQLILNLKKPPERRTRPREWHHKEGAIKKCAEVIAEFFDTNWLKTATLVPMPPSKATDDPAYDDRMVQVLNKVQAVCRSRLDIRELILQKESVPPSHRSAVRRNPSEIVNGLRLDPSLLTIPSTGIALFDDVIASGAHYCAAKQLVHEVWPELPIVGIFIARSLH